MLGKYEKLDVLGHGASGIVYLAKDTLLNRQVALKVVDIQAGEIAHFIEEARVLDRLRHPNIVRVHSIDRIDGNIVLDMEYVRGKNLQETLRQQGPFEMQAGIELGIQMLDALEYAHQMQTVHRDIKPANILIGREGEVKLVDFGLAEILATNSYAGGAGTYAYMAPEDFAEEERSDHQSDIWAAGVTLFEILTGYKPFQSAKARDPYSWKRVLENDLPRPLLTYMPDATPELQEIFNKALAKSKLRRYQKAADFRDDLKTTLAATSRTHAPHARSDKPSFAARFPKLTGSGDSADQIPQTTPGQKSDPPLSHRRRDAANPSVASNPPYVQALNANSLAAGKDAGKTVDSEGDRTIRRGASLTQSGTLSRESRSSLQRHPIAEVARISPQSANMGRVAPGGQKTFRLNVQVSDAVGDVHAQVTACPEWLRVNPLVFTSGRQALTFTSVVPADRPEGAYEDEVQILIDGQTLTVPVKMSVSRPRQSLFQVSIWFFPLIFMSILPALTVVAAGSAQHPIPVSIVEYLPTGFSASAILAIMLLLISLAANVSWFARLLCGGVVLGMGFALGTVFSHWQPSLLNFAFLRAIFVSLLLAGCMIVQLLSMRLWRVWSVVLLGFSLSISLYLAHQLHLVNLSELLKAFGGGS